VGRPTRPASPPPSRRCTSRPGDRPRNDRRHGRRLCHRVPVRHRRDHPGDGAGRGIFRIDVKAEGEALPPPRATPRRSSPPATSRSPIPICTACRCEKSPGSAGMSSSRAVMHADALTVPAGDGRQRRRRPSSPSGRCRSWTSGS
jgi:hypothetical protein